MSEDPATPRAEKDVKTQDPAAVEARRAGGMRHLAALLPRLTRPALGKRGFAEGGIVADWPDIVGPDLAAASLPERLAFSRGARRDGTLHVRVSGALALELQHLEPMVVERINGYFGYRAVARLRIRQGPIPRSRRRQAPPAHADPATLGAIDHAVSLVSDPGLRSALAGFGRALHGRKG